MTVGENGQLKIEGRTRPVIRKRKSAKNRESKVSFQNGACPAPEIKSSEGTDVFRVLMNAKQATKLNPQIRRKQKPISKGDYINLIKGQLMIRNKFGIISLQIPDRESVRNKSGTNFKLIPPDESEGEQADYQLGEVTSAVDDKCSKLVDIENRGLNRSR